ncbi:hypothetical protein ACL03H_13850 [Saccharopolyspora sp. MS10]|uniref:hypothetical protein n=1 Tax=Saccharopolyspora sp. MS10 TaxID=3385973 RepID=UPI00399FA038
MTTPNVQTPSVPSTINGAALAYLASAIVPLVWGLIVLSSGGMPPTPGVSPQVAQTFLVASVAMSVISLLVYLWLSWKLRAGRNWARIVLAVFAVLHLSVLFGPADAESYIGLGLALLGLVLSFLPASSRYIADVTR